MLTNEQIVTDELGLLDQWEVPVASRLAFSRAVVAALEAAGRLVPDGWEWGVEYEVTADRSEFTVACNEKQAREWASQSPTDTGLRRRRPAGPWIEVSDE